MQERIQNAKDANPAEGIDSAFQQPPTALSSSDIQKTQQRNIVVMGKKDRYLSRAQKRQGAFIPRLSFYLHCLDTFITHPNTSLLALMQIKMKYLLKIRNIRHYSPRVPNGVIGNINIACTSLCKQHAKSVVLEIFFNNICVTVACPIP